MKNTTPTLDEASSHAACATTVPLHTLIDQLMTGLLPLVEDKKSYLVNDVDRAFVLHTDENVLAFILGNLLSGAVNNTRNVCIRVEAVEEAGKVDIHVHNDGVCFSGSAMSGLSQVLKAARKMGGDVSVRHARGQGTTLTFSILLPL